MGSGSSTKKGKVKKMKITITKGDEKKRPLLSYAKKGAELKRVKAAFEAIDKDNSGHLDPEEVKSYLLKQGYGETDARDFFKRTDVDDDGRIDFEEFDRGWHFINAYQIFGRKKGEKTVRKPGSMKGVDCVIDECNGATVQILDHLTAAQIDRCNDCNIVVGPCKGSVFVRDCENCTFSLAVQQLRTRNCRNCTFYLYAKTEPIIESSSSIQVAPWNVSYPKLNEHFKIADFDPKENLWWAVFDFTERSGNWEEQDPEDWREETIRLEDEEGMDMGRPQNPVPRHARAEKPVERL